MVEEFWPSKSEASGAFSVYEFKATGHIATRLSSIPQLLSDQSHPVITRDTIHSSTVIGGLNLGQLTRESSRRQQNLHSVHWGMCMFFCLLKIHN